MQQDLCLQLQEKYPKLTTGDIKVHIGSLHLYERHYNLAKAMLDEPHQDYYIRLKKPIPLGRKPEYYHNNIPKLIEV